MAKPRWSTALNRHTAVVFAVQTLAYGSLVALSTHDAATPFVSILQQVPRLPLIVLSIAAVPAVAITIGLGQALEYVFGVRVTQVDPILVTRGDVLFFVVAAVLSIVVVRISQRIRAESR